MESRCLVMLFLVLWFLMLGGGGWCEGCLEEERVALSRLKPFFPFLDSTFGGPRGLDYFSYPVQKKESSIDCCKWERVECNPTTGRLTHLFLNFTGQFDVVLFEDYSKKKWYLNASLFLPFEELQYLSLSGNYIAGCVADQGFERFPSRLKKLEIFDLSSNYFNDSILTLISELSSLKSLNLEGNQLTLLNLTNGIKMLSKLNNLETLNLSRNNLRNNILSQLHDFTSLKSLNLQGCGLEGIINLLEFNTLTNLMELYLDDNGIEGIESSFQEKGELRLNKLEVLGLAGNQFTNTIFTSLAALPNLKSLNLGFNKLKGAIDVKDLNALSNLEELVLTVNGVTELVPSQELRLMNLKVLLMVGNPLDNSILATFGRFLNLKTLYFGVTQLNESIDITEMDGLKNLEDLGMSCYPDNDCKISLQSLNLFSSLKFLHLDGFDIKETRIHSHSQNEWQNLTNLEELVLLDSSLPFNFIGILPSLKQLYMDNCYLDDSLFMQDTFKLKNLETLRVSGTFLGNNFLKRIGAMPSLKILSLDYYGLDGTLHSQDDHFSPVNNFLQNFGTMLSLKFLRLSSCGLNDTLQSQGFCGLTNLRALDMRNNHLTGGLPEHLTMGCSSLTSLILSNNRLQGQMFSSKFNLTNLWKLRLDGNHFSGKIPDSLSNCSQLSTLDVSNNELVGGIPRWMENMSNRMSKSKSSLEVKVTVGPGPGPGHKG
ncbi:hypothetical protein V6N13_144658 [Hibiscus sabdariffa]